MDENTADILIALAGIAVVAVVLLVRFTRLNDPADTRVIHLDDLPRVAQLSNGPCEAILIRQSGGVYRELGQLESAEAAVAEVMKSLRRAKIGELQVPVNRGDRLEVRRLTAAGRQNEGKKLGGALIARI